MKVCKNCNNLFSDDANFCPDCGSQLESVQIYDQAKPKPKLVKRIKNGPEKPGTNPVPHVPVLDNIQNHQSDSAFSTANRESTTIQFAPDFFSHSQSGYRYWSILVYFLFCSKYSYGFSTHLTLIMTIRQEQF